MGDVLGYEALEEVGCVVAAERDEAAVGEWGDVVLRSMLG